MDDTAQLESSYKSPDRRGKMARSCPVRPEKGKNSELRIKDRRLIFKPPSVCTPVPNSVCLSKHNATKMIAFPLDELLVHYSRFTGNHFRFLKQFAVTHLYSSFILLVGVRENILIMLPATREPGVQCIYQYM